VDLRPSELGEHAAAVLARIEKPHRARQLYLAEPKLLRRQSG